MLILNYNNDIAATITHPSRSRVQKLINTSLQKPYNAVVINVEIISNASMAALNREYRGKNYPTNIISLEYPDQGPYLNGEIFLCHELIKIEARCQNKKILNHYCHLIVHGMLHLQGFDHITEEDAAVMEDLEIKILGQFSIQNPYS